MAVTDKFRKASNGTRAVPTTLASPKTNGSSTAVIAVNTGWPTATGVDVIIYRIDTNGVVVAGTQTDWIGELTGTTIGNMVLKAGTEPVTGYPGDSQSVVKVGITAAWADSLVDGLLTSLNQDGTLKTAAVQTALNTGNLLNTGFTPLGFTPNTVTYNGNHSYTCVFNSVDLTGVLSAGMRLAVDRTVNAQTQVTSLNGTTQYWTKTSPAGMTFTDDFVAGGWIKINAYSAGSQAIISRYNGTSGWLLDILGTGQIRFRGVNASAGNFSQVQSFQSVPLNKWVHIAAQLDMSAFTATATTSYIMLDGSDIPAAVTRGGTNPAALVQAGDLEVGSFSGGSSPLGGQIAQPFVFSGKLTQDVARSYYSQGLTGTEPTLVSAYDFNGNALDKNTTNANNLTAVASAGYVTDSPFSNGTKAAAGLDYGLVFDDPVFSAGNTTVNVIMADNNAIPTSGGVASVAYSSQYTPFGMPNIDSITKYSRSLLSLSALSLTNATTDLRTVGLVQVVTTRGNATAQVRVDLGITSTSDYEFVVRVFLNGVIAISHQPAAALASATNRSMSRGFTADILLPDGTNTISGAVTLNASTSSQLPATAGAMTVTIVKGLGTGI